MNEVDKIERDGFTITSYYDEDAQNPREDSDCHVGVMVLDHGRYDLPNEDDDAKRALDWFMSRKSGLSLFSRWARIFKGATIVLPVWGYDHSGLAMRAGDRVGQFADQWDSGLLGVIYDDATNVVDWTAEQIEAALRGEVEEYDMFGRGEVYGYIVTDRNGDEVDSCWGYVGSEYFETVIKEILENLPAQPERIYDMRLSARQLEIFGASNG